MKPNRLNLCPPVRESLIASGFSTVKVISAVNAEIGKCELTEQTDKTGDGRVTKLEYKVAVTVSMKYSGKLTLPRLFDAWHGKVAGANKIAVFDTVAIPGVFAEWLNGFAKADPKEKEEASA